jgi:HEAT repeat protein
MVRTRALAGADDENAAEKAEAASAGTLVQMLLKAARGFVIYLPNNPLHEKFFEDLMRALRAHLEEFGTLRLEVEHDQIRCDEEVIYANPELRENLAFRMYADGVRALSFEEGIAPAEMRAFVEIVGRVGSEDPEDDIVTRLWSAGLTHLTYQLADTPVASGAAELGLAAAGSLLGSAGAAGGGRAAQEGAFRRFAAGLTTLPPPPRLLPVPQQVFSLTEEELEGIRGQLEEEEQRRPLDDVAAILRAILAVEADGALFAELLDVVGRLCADLAAIGRLDQSVTLLEVLNATAAVAALPHGHAEAIAAARERVLAPEVVAALTRTLARGDGALREDLRALVRALGPVALGPFCRVLGEVPGKETRKALIDALVETGQGAPGPFLPFLDDERWYLVRNTVYILRRLAAPAAAGQVRRLVAHRDPRVRKEVLHFFDEVPDPAAEAVLIRLLEDETPALRTAAARALARRRSRPAAERLRSMVELPAFAARPREEREALWEALAELDPERMLPVFRGMLEKRRWFAQAKELDDVACAAAGLRRIGTADALDALRSAAASRRGEAQEILERALRAAALGGPRAPRAGKDEAGA